MISMKLAKASRAGLEWMSTCSRLGSGSRFSAEGAATAGAAAGAEAATAAATGAGGSDREDWALLGLTRPTSIWPRDAVALNSRAGWAPNT